MGKKRKHEAGEIFVENEGGNTIVEISDEEDRIWYLLEIEEGTGRIFRHTDIPRHFGFDLDGKGRLKIER